MNALRCFFISLAAVLTGCGDAPNGADNEASEGALETRVSGAIEVTAMRPRSAYVADDTHAYWLSHSDNGAGLHAAPLTGGESRELWRGQAADKALGQDDESIYFAAGGSLLRVRKKGADAPHVVASYSRIRKIVAIATQQKGNDVVVEFSDATVLETVQKNGASDQEFELTRVNRVSPGKLRWSSDGEFVYAVHSGKSLLAYPFGDLSTSTPRTLWRAPAESDAELDTFRVARPGDAFIGFGSEASGARIGQPQRRRIVIEGASGRAEANAESILADDAAVSSETIDATTHCALRESGANLTGRIACIKPGSTRPFIAIPFHGISMANVVQSGKDLLWEEIQGSLFVKR